MPELPEVETTGRGLNAALRDHTILAVERRRENLRSPIPANLETLLKGAKLSEVTRRAKYLLLRFSNKQTLLVHLGMSGRLTVASTPGQEKHDHLVFHFSDDRYLTFNDARRFGRVEIMATAHEAQHPLIHKLGPEPLTESFTAEVLALQLKNKKVEIKPALLDQTVVAGVGNIYASEALHLAAIHPEIPAGQLSLPRLNKLVGAIKVVLNAAIEAGGSTLRDYRQTSGELGFYQDRFTVYGRDGARCPNCTCASSIKMIVQAGRATYFCKKQKR